MPKPTFLNLPDAKRDRITELALDEFSTHPYRQASLSRIVARAGIAKGSMYQYFENKLDLYRWLVTDELERRRNEWLESDVPRPENPVDHGGLFADIEQLVLTRVGCMVRSDASRSSRSPIASALLAAAVRFVATSILGPSRI
jgi:AcrR family transcriptional regulator